MFIPNVSKLQWQRWLISSITTRLEALQESENQLASLESRQPCTVCLLGEEYVPQDPTQGFVAGEHGFNKETGVEEIRINPKLMEEDEPYLAVETQFHESRHAYQTHAINDPQSQEDPSSLKKWRENKEIYFPPGDHKLYSIDDASYRYQPLEVDANNTARDRMQAMYAGQEQDQHQYQSYREWRDDANQIERDSACNILKTNQPEEKISQEVSHNYAQLHQSEEDNGKTSLKSEEDQKPPVESQPIENLPEKECVTESQEPADFLTQKNDEGITSSESESPVKDNTQIPSEPEHYSERIAERFPEINQKECESEIADHPLVEEPIKKEPIESVESETSSENEGEDEYRYYGMGL